MKERKYWEHKVEPLSEKRVDQEEELEELGKSGWELVAVTVSATDGSTAYLKRRWMT